MTQDHALTQILVPRGRSFMRNVGKKLPIVAKIPYFLPLSLLIGNRLPNP